MKVILIHVGDILKYPPVISLINALDAKGIETLVITTESKYNDKIFNNVKFEVLDFCYELMSPLRKLINIFSTRRNIEKILASQYNEDSIIWITYNVSLKHLNIKCLKKYNYVLQLMELSETIRFYEKLPIKFDMPTIANNAVAVVVPEYNRAHITKAWWGVDKLPLVLPNKPFYEENIVKNSNIEDAVANEVFAKLSNKKVVLYQGILTKERPLEVFIKAINRLGDDYAFVVMSSGDNIYSEIESKNYYFIPYVKPPYHLQITSNAYIGVLTYISTKSEFSPLNALYCAPNKTYEYSMFGIPMLGNDLPGLKFLFETNNCGVCFEDFTEDSIIEAIKKIEDSYDVMSHNSRKYFDKVDYNDIVENIMRTIDSRVKEEY